MKPVRSRQSVNDSQTTLDHDSPVAPFSQSFFSNNPAMKRGRAIYFKIVPFSVFLVVAVIIFGVLPIFWSSIYKAPEHIQNLGGWIVVSTQLDFCRRISPEFTHQDLDGGEVGKSATQAFLSVTGSPTSMSWSVDTSLKGDSDFEDAVVNEKTWMIVASKFFILDMSIIPADSKSVNQAIASADGNYNGSNAIALWVNEARNQNA